MAIDHNLVADCDAVAARVETAVEGGETAE